MTTNIAAVAAREQSRDVSGEFGTQTHTDSGIVETTPVSLTDQAIVELRIHQGDVDDFKGTFGENCRSEMSQLASQIRKLEETDPEVSFPLYLEDVASDDDYVGDTKVGFTFNGLEITRSFDFTDLYNDERTGEDCARQLAAEMLAQRDKVVDEFLTATCSSAVKRALVPPVVYPDTSVKQGMTCHKCERPATFTTLILGFGAGYPSKRLYACGIHGRATKYGSWDRI